MASFILTTPPIPGKQPRRPRIDGRRMARERNVFRALATRVAALAALSALPIFFKTKMAMRAPPSAPRT